MTSAPLNCCSRWTTAPADIDSARLLLTHTRIVAPVAARTGAITVHPGSLAQTSAAAPLVTLVQQAPIGVELNLADGNDDRGRPSGR